MTKTKKSYKVSGLNCKLCNSYQPKLRRLGFCGCITSDSDYCNRSIVLNGKKRISREINPERIEILRSKYTLLTHDQVKPKITHSEAYQPTIREKKEFYESWMWKELRFKILQKYNATCLLCGASSRDAKICVDHIRPISLYWSKRFDLDNLQTLCEDCNKGKSNKHITDFRRK